MFATSNIGLLAFLCKTGYDIRPRWIDFWKRIDFNNSFMRLFSTSTNGVEVFRSLHPNHCVRHAAWWKWEVSLNGKSCSLLRDKDIVEFLRHLYVACIIVWTLFKLPDLQEKRVIFGHDSFLFFVLLLTHSVKRHHGWYDVMCVRYHSGS